jgi:alpha-glucosidase (family GH31 glycosyl hydrolase)
VTQIQAGFASPDGESFYGFGERFQALDQRGCLLDNHVFAQYVHQGKRTYIPIPFFLSSRGYGFWLNTNRQAYFDMAAQEPTCWTVTGSPDANGAGLEMIVFLQDTPTRIIQAFTDLTGKPKLPPAWVFGLWLSSNDWNSQAEVLRQLSLSQLHGIPASVMVIEAWSDEITFYIWNDARYRQKPSSQAYGLDDFSFPEAGRWPDPKAMIDEIHAAGLHLVLWQIPVLKREVPEEDLDPAQKNADQDFAVRNGYLVRQADGTPHRIEAHSPWFANSPVFDFTHPQAAQWWMDKRRYLVAEMGVDGFKTDGGEHVWTPDTRFANGMQGRQGINHYPLAYQGAYHRFLENYRGSDHVLFSRSGYTGIQKVSCHWTGDEASTWDAFRSTIHGMLNAGICGIAFLGWDIAGFAGEIPSSDLYRRAAAFSAFCPIMQFHSDYNARRKPSRDRTPWNIQERTGDPQVIPTFRKFANLRMNLFPYIGSEARYCSQTGLPLMRALALDFHDDQACKGFPYQYLFGRSLLVAPVVEPGADSCRVYLPQNHGHPELWYDLWTGFAYEGGQAITVEAPHDLIPVFVRGGSVLPLNLGESLELGSPVGNRFTGYRQLSFWIFPRSGDACQEWRDPVSESAFAMNTNFQRSEENLGIFLPRMPYSPALIIPSIVPLKARLDGQDLAWIQDSHASPWSGKSTSIRLAYQLTRLDQPVHLELDGWSCPTSPT